ncbi:MAG: hypothetical protein JWN45_634 [Acidobacteriaceae bacterium]|nr:hypothetical protein [Acidobacteriaceae bacterium]
MAFWVHPEVFKARMAVYFRQGTTRTHQKGLDSTKAEMKQQHTMHFPKRRPITVLLSALFLLALLPSFASAQESQDRGESNLNTAQPNGTTPEQIIQKFAAREKEFAQAREDYTYRQYVKVETLDGDTPDGEYQQIVDVTFDDKNRRHEQVVFSPQSSLARVSMDQEDFEDIQHRYPFVLTSDELPLYQIVYAGQQKIDEVDTYVFDVAPKNVEKGKRYFQGRIWVDNRDFQIVKSHGKPAYMKEKKLEGHLFPAFTTYREQIDGKYWFPTYSRADEVLHFPPSRGNPIANDVHIRITVKYQDYKRFASRTKIIYGSEVPDNQQPPPQQQPKK